MLASLLALVEKKPKQQPENAQSSAEAQPQIGVDLSQSQEALLSLSPPGQTYLPASTPTLIPTATVIVTAPSTYGSTPPMAISPPMDRKASSSSSSRTRTQRTDAIPMSFRPPHLIEDEDAVRDDDDSHLEVGSPPGAHPHKYRSGRY